MCFFSKLEEKFFGFIVRLSGKLAVQVNRSVDNEVLGHYSEHIGQLNKLGRDVSARDFEEEIEQSKDFRKKDVNAAVPSVMSGLSLVVSVIALFVSIVACVISVVLFFMDKHV